MAPRMLGRITCRKVKARLAPRSIDASTTSPPSRRNLAEVLLNTTTMQNVACATTNVKNVSPPRNDVNMVLRARPVTMPGSAIGSTTSREIVLCPKNFVPDRANDTSVPSTRATNVATVATTTDVTKASLTPSFDTARDHHSSVNPGGGHANVRLVLKLLTRMINNGM